MNFIELSDAYLSDRHSPIHKLRWVTQQGYGRLIERISRDLGEREMKTITTRAILDVYARWADGGKIHMGHSLVTMLRVLISFGSSVLEDPDCQRLRGIMSGLRFKNGSARTTWLTEDQAAWLRDEAIGLDYYAIALAQAFQFDCALRQKDAIGEWIPIGRPEPSVIVSKDGTEKWVRGITREEVDADMILTHETSKRGQILAFPLKDCPSVMEEWFSAPPSGPLIIDPETDLPYEAWKYRRIWRWLAGRAGIPKNVRNMDSRAGRITERLAIGVSLEDARKLAGHNQQATTSLYSRGTPEAIARALNAKQPPGTYPDDGTKPWRQD